MANHIDKKITLISGADDVKIKNLQSNFQNYLHDRFYLNQNVHRLGLSLSSVSVDLQFHNPICSLNDKYPQFIVTTVKDFKKHKNINIQPEFKHFKKKILFDVSIQQFISFWIIKELENNKGPISLFDFTNDQKFYLKSNKRYTITDLYNEWIGKQHSVYENITKCTTTSTTYPGQFMKLDKDSNSLWFDNFQQTNATIKSEIYIKPIIADYIDEALIMFFHNKFYNALNLVHDENMKTHCGEYSFDNEKYFYVIIFQRRGIKIDINDRGLYFKTPNLMKIVCKQITMIEDDNQYSQVMAITSIDEEDKFKHKEFKFSGEETFPLQSNTNDHIEILLLDENNKRIILSNSLPTLVTLYAKMLKNDEFHIRFSSDNEQYKSNTPTNFKYLMNAPAMVNEEYHVALLNINFKNEFLPDKSFDFYFMYRLYDDSGVPGDDKKISLNDKCLNAKDVYRNFMSEINGLVDSEGESIIEAKTNTEDILTFTYKRNASFTFSYHLTRILGIREQTYKISKIINEPSEDVNDSNESIENAEDTKKPKLHKDFNLGYAVHTKDPVITAKHPGIRYSYINKIRNVDNVNDLVDQFIDILQEKTNIDMHLEERRLRLVFPYDLTLEIQPHLANILGFTDVSRQFTYNAKKGSEYTTSYDILQISLLEAVPKEFRKFEFLKHMENAVIEVSSDDNKGGTYTCSVPINKEYQIEQKMIFIQSNIVKSTPVANGNGKILKTIVAKKPGVYEENNFYDKPEFVPLQHDTFQTIDIKFTSLSGDELICKDPNNTTTHCHLLIRRFKKPKSSQSLANY